MAAANIIETAEKVTLKPAPASRGQARGRARGRARGQARGRAISLTAILSDLIIKLSLSIFG